MNITAKISKSYTANEISIVQMVGYLKKNFECEISFTRSSYKNITVARIRKVVVDYFELSDEILDSKTRKREIVQARQLSHFFCMKYTNKSSTIIGHLNGGKDHATVLHSIKTINNLMDTDRHFKAMVLKIEKML